MQDNLVTTESQQRTRSRVSGGTSNFPTRGGHKSARAGAMARRASKAPRLGSGGVIPNINHRHFTDDIPFGLVPVKDLAQRVGASTPVIDEMIRWHQVLMGKEYIVGSELSGADMSETGAMVNYGLDDLDAYIGQDYGDLLTPTTA